MADQPAREEAACVWIDTDGRFKMQAFVKLSNSDPKAAAAAFSRVTNEAGYPCVVIMRNEIIAGEFKNNAQLEEEDESAEG
jgi:hypothetical protein